MLNSPRNMNLAYLNLYTYNDFAKGITADFSNIKALHTPINDYLRTIYLDDISAFLILYSILETLADTETVYFDEKDIMKQVFESLFESFIQGMRNANEGKDEKYSNSSSNFKAIKQKWGNLSDGLTQKPKEMNPIKKIIKDNNIDWKKLNRHFSTVKKKGTGIKDIKDLRNTIVHDRKEDYTELLDMKNINSDLSFAVCIILLRKMGITNVDFDKNWEIHFWNIRLRIKLRVPIRSCIFSICAAPICLKSRLPFSCSPMSFLISASTSNNNARFLSTSFS